MTDKTDYRIVKLTDGTTLMGSIAVDKDFLRITNALELQTVQRHTDFGVKDDTSLAPWIPFTNDKTFVVPRDKILVITQADKHISHYYEVVLNKLQKAAATVKPPLSAQEMEKIYKLADQMDKHIKDHLDEGDLLPDNDLFRKRTLH